MDPHKLQLYEWRKRKSYSFFLFIHVHIYIYTHTHYAVFISIFFIKIQDKKTTFIHLYNVYKIYKYIKNYIIYEFKVYFYLNFN